MGAAEFIALVLAVMFIGFQMGREWQRVYSLPDCPYPGTCVTCNPRTSAACGTVHVQYTQWSPPFQTYPAAD
jgi:hypothetical protein